jgi:2-polyprenyl-3-methyl-5-hydroxy-6-metoxy-1,4-benzoquinol methylase
MRSDHWLAEASFFDGVAAEHRALLRPFEEIDLHRYREQNLRRRFAREFRMRTLCGLQGKRVLDVGCGEGVDTVLLAKLGADEVVGVDLSPGAIALAGERARLNGVADRVRFVCAPIETAAIEPQAYDVVWCNAILHHLTDNLDPVMARITSWCHPDGVLSFAEPTNFNPTLRRLRKLVPLRLGKATADERPLEPRDLKIMRRHVRDLKQRHFSLLGRIDGFVLERFNYERSSWPRRLVCNAAATADWWLLSVPGIDRLGSITVLWGSPNCIE